MSEFADEFAPWLAEHIRTNPEFVAAYRRVSARMERQRVRYRIRAAMSATAPLCINGAEYRRRQKSRTSRRPA